MDSIDPLTLLPPSWLVWLHQWGPTILAVLVVTTVLVRVALPLARRLEGYAIRSRATWDDGPARSLVLVLEWTAGITTVVLSLVPHLTIGPPKSGAETGSARRRPPPLPLLVLALAALLVAGCSSGPQVPIQGTPVTIQIEAGACNGRSSGGETPVPVDEGPRAVGTCSVAIWVDSPASSSQATRGVETGPVDVSPDTDVSLTGSP